MASPISLRAHIPRLIRRRRPTGLASTMRIVKKNLLRSSRIVLAAFYLVIFSLIFLGGLAFIRRDRH